MRCGGPQWTSECDNEIVKKMFKKSWAGTQNNIKLKVKLVTVKGYKRVHISCVCYIYGKNALHLAGQEYATTGSN